MKRIGVLGANGQVGTEVCAFLNHWDGVKVTAICRNAFSSSVLRRLGIECRHGDITNPDEAAQLIADCDVVFDCILPMGSYAELAQTYDRIYASVLAAIPAHVKYVIASSQMALGFGGSSRRLCYRWLPRTVYGASKRFAERRARMYAGRNGNPLYVLRLAQVQGIIQGCSDIFRDLAREGLQFRVQAGPSYTVFCYSIAEAVVNIAQGRERPGTYTVDSNPAWSWKEVLSFLARRDVDCIEIPAPHAGLQATVGVLRNYLLQHREFFQANVLRYFPRWEQRLRTRKRLQEARSAVAEVESCHQVHVEMLFGTLPGKRLQSLSDSRQTMSRLWKICEEEFAYLAPQAREQIPC